MHVVLIGLFIFAVVVYFAVIKRASRLDKAIDLLEDAKVSKEVDRLNKKTEKILNSINKEDK